ncbi:MAG: metallophosphoesterase, partial [Bacteroidota bacterium]
MTRFIVILSVIYIVLAIYGFQAFRTLFKSPAVHVVYVIAYLAVWGYLVFKLVTYVPGSAMQGGTAIAGGVFFSFFLLALFLGFFLLLEDVVRLSVYGFNKIAGVSDESVSSFPSRRKFLSAIGLGLAALPFGALLYGMYKGKYNYQVLKYELEFDDLPDAFNGYQITQISDVHSGSFDNAEKVSYGVDLVNQQNSDVILFTGDIVNDRCEELRPWADTFSRLEAKDGVFSILGNHDYGDYTQWPSKEAKVKNLDDLKQLQREIGFDLLLDEHRYLERNGERIALLGVENWGRGRFKKAGDLQKAKEGVAEDDFKILMSHDPSHWEDEVIHDDY